MMQVQPFAAFFFSSQPHESEPTPTQGGRGKPRAPALALALALEPTLWSCLNALVAIRFQGGGAASEVDGLSRSQDAALSGSGPTPEPGPPQDCPGPGDHGQAVPCDETILLAANSSENTEFQCVVPCLMVGLSRPRVPLPVD
jgi:hypothetical protein